MMKDRLVEVTERNETRYDFISKNGITYQLLEGVTFGKSNHTSCMVFITLDVFSILDDELPTEIEDRIITLMGGCCMKFIDFFHSQFIACGGAIDLVEDNCTIRNYVDKFETENAELVKLIKAYSITTAM